VNSVVACCYGAKLCAHAAQVFPIATLVGTSTITYNLRPYIGSQTFVWSLVKVSSKLSSLPWALSSKCAFLGLLRESVRRVYGTPTLLLKCSFAGLLLTSVLESFWRLISMHLTWISCGDWIDRRRHSKTLSFLLSSARFFATWNSSRAVQRLRDFFTTKLVIAAWLINSIEIFSAAQIDKLTGLNQTLAAWLTNFFDIFSLAHILPYDLQTESNFYDLTHLRQTFAETNVLFWQMQYCD